MEQVWFIAGPADLLVARDDLSIVRQRLPEGDEPPLHVHHDEDEAFYVLSGELTLWVGDEDPVTLGPGESVLAPRGVPHTYRTGAPTEVIVTTNGTFAQFVRAAAGERPDPERLARTATDYGITLLGDREGITSSSRASGSPTTLR